MSAQGARSAPVSDTWWAYVQRFLAGRTAKEVAEKAGLHGSAFTRWSKGAKADPEFVVKLARAYSANVLEALVASGLVTAEEAALQTTWPISTAEQLSQISTHSLINELHRRSQANWGDPA